jgi:hypothetical protein
MEDQGMRLSEPHPLPRTVRSRRKSTGTDPSIRAGVAFHATLDPPTTYVFFYTGMIRLYGHDTSSRRPGFIRYGQRARAATYEAGS